MLDIKKIRKDPKAIEQKLKTKDETISLEPLLKLDEEVRVLKTKVEELQTKRNQQSGAIGKLKKEGKPAEAEMAAVRAIGDELSTLNHKLTKLEEAFTTTLASLPNLPFDNAPVSLNKEDNVIYKEVGTKPTFAFKPKNHLELNDQLNLFAFKETAKTSGTGWPAYRGMGARLEWALLSYMIDMQVLRGFELWLPPIAVRPPMMFASGQLPKFKGQFYEIDDPNNPLYLIPTSEVVLNGIHTDEIIPEEQLPIKYAAYTPCFRKEAGAAGADERGLIRVHQFNKVEMFAFTKPEESEKMFEEMLSVAEEIVTGLGLHYRLANLVTGDISFAGAKTVDLEVWLPGQNRYYEVSSISNCTDYQARRSHIRYRPDGGKTNFIHTLNGSGLATSRLMVGLLECNQQEDGSVILPPVLAEKLGTHVLKT